MKICKMIERSKQKKMCVICGKYYKQIQNHISSRKHRKVLLNDTGNEEMKEYGIAYKSRLRSYRINNCNNVKSILGFLERKRNVVIGKRRKNLGEFNGIKVT